MSTRRKGEMFRKSLHHNLDYKPFKNIFGLPLKTLRLVSQV